jgi:hypothetical protein
MKHALLFLFLAAQAPLVSQVPGGYPPSLPSSQGPNIPLPSRHKKDTAPPTQRFAGKLRKVDDQSIVVEVPDGRILTFKRTDKTKFAHDEKEIKPAELKGGNHVIVEATEDAEGFLYAQKVSLDSAPPAEESAAAPEAEETGGRGAGNTPAPVDTDTNEPGPPKIKRGMPAAKADAETEAEDSPASSPGAQSDETPEPPPVDDPVIVKAKQATVTFTEKLPNYVCKEFMARYASSRQPPEWRALDVVSTNIVYEGGHESYRDLAINDKPVHKGMEEMSGAWSTGEFGTMLLDLFAPWTAAEFRLRRRATIAGLEARVYDFEVEHARSHWKVQVASQSMLPAYKGSVWIEPETGQVLRLEIAARALPKEFPVDTVESAVDYERVLIGGKKFLLPVHAETLACERGSSNCTRNAIDFRNYHKFESSSDVTFASDK